MNCQIQFWYATFEVSTNNQTVQQWVNKALFRLLGDDLDNEEARLFLTDAALFCLKAGHGLSSLYPNLLHCLCIAYGLNRVAEQVRCEFPKVDMLIAEGKKVFLMCPRHRAEFADACKVPLPPEPILTRCIWNFNHKNATIALMRPVFQVGDLASSSFFLQ